MSFLKTNKIKIYSEGEVYDSLADLRLAIENTDYIGDLISDDGNLIFVPGRDGPLDITDEVYGEQYYQYREIKIIFGGLDAAESWDERISAIRDIFDGKMAQIEFETLKGWKFEGRVKITDFGRNRGLAKFQFGIPYAYPYMIREHEQRIRAISAGTTATLINDGKISVSPSVEANKNITIEHNGKTYAFDAGESVDPDFILNPGQNSIKATGANAEVIIRYRAGRK